MKNIVMIGVEEDENARDVQARKLKRWRKGHFGGALRGKKSGPQC